MEKVAIIIPAYNEEKNIKHLVDNIQGLKQKWAPRVDIIVVNDCSIDNTLEIASGLDCIVLDLPINLGIGGAVQTGLQYAFAHGYDFAVQVDGDGQHSPEDIPKLIKAMLCDESDVVIGSRFIESAGFQSSFLRRIGIKYFSFIIKLLTGLVIFDCTSGFRIFNRKALFLASNYYPDQYPEPESILFFTLSGLKISEVPVAMNPRTTGISSIRHFASLYYVAKTTLAIFFTFVKLKSWKL